MVGPALDVNLASHAYYVPTTRPANRGARGAFLRRTPGGVTIDARHRPGRSVMATAVALSLTHPHAGRGDALCALPRGLRMVGVGPPTVLPPPRQGRSSSPHVDGRLPVHVHPHAPSRACSSSACIEMTLCQMCGLQKRRLPGRTSWGHRRQRSHYRSPVHSHHQRCPRPDRRCRQPRSSPGCHWHTPPTPGRQTADGKGAGHDVQAREGSLSGRTCWQRFVSTSRC